MTSLFSTRSSLPARSIGSMLWRISRMCCFECSGTQRGTSRTSCRIGGSHFLPGDADQSRALGKDCQDVQLGTVTHALRTSLPQLPAPRPESSGGGSRPRHGSLGPQNDERAPVCPWSPSLALNPISSPLSRRLPRRQPHRFLDDGHHLAR